MRTIKNIAISGWIGTGKSTLARNLAQKFGWQYLSGGEYFRKWHQEQGIPLEDSGKVPEELDRQFDGDIKKKLENEEGIIYEAHLAGWLAKDLASTFKILCTADEKVALERASIRDGLTLEEEKTKAYTRHEANKNKFKRMYGVDDYLSKEYFDLVVDTTTLTKEEVLDQVLSELSQATRSL